MAIISEFGAKSAAKAGTVLERFLSKVPTAYDVGKGALIGGAVIGGVAVANSVGTTITASAKAKTEQAQAVTAQKSIELQELALAASSPDVKDLVDKALNNNDPTNNTLQGAIAELRKLAPWIIGGALAIGGIVIIAKKGKK